MRTLEEHIDDLDRMVDGGAERPKVRRLLMGLFRHVDKQGSPTLTHTVAHVVGSCMLVAIAALSTKFWNHIPSMMFFVFGSQSPLRKSVNVEVWGFIPLGILLWLYLQRVVIRSATYGSASKSSDVTEVVRKMVENDGLRAVPVSNEALGGTDPDFGNVKSLTVEYSVWGRRRKKSAREGECIKLN